MGRGSCSRPSSSNRLMSYAGRVGGGSIGYDALGLHAITRGLSVAFEGGSGADSFLISSALASALARAQPSSAAANQTPLSAALAVDSTVSTTGAVSTVWWNASRLPVRVLQRGAAGDTAVTTTTYNLTLQPLLVETSGRAPVIYGYAGSPVPLLTSVTQGALGETTTYTYGPFDQVKTVHVNGIKMSEAFFASASALTPDSVKTDTANTVRQKVDAFGRLRSTRDARQVFDTAAVESTHGNTLTTTRYLIQDDQVVLEVDGSNGVLAEYTYYPGTDRPHGMRRGGVQYFYAQDAQGNVTGLMSGSGTVVETYEYTPQGAMIGSSGSVGNPYRWKGREWDAEAGLYYVRARYYDPVVGRFVSEDPIGTAGGPNQYAFAAGDPVNFSDPSGLFPGACPLALQSMGYASIVVGHDGSGRPIYSCWYIRLPPVWVTASADPGRGGSPYRSRGASAMDYMNGSLTIPFGDDFGGESPHALMSLCAASSLAFATGVVSDLYLAKGLLKGVVLSLQGQWRSLAGNGAATTLFQTSTVTLRQQTRYARSAFFAGEMAAADALATYGVMDAMQVSAVAAVSGSQPTLRDLAPGVSTWDAGVLVSESCPSW